MLVNVGSDAPVSRYAAIYDGAVFILTVISQTLWVLAVTKQKSGPANHLASPLRFCD
jgi:hypothetical protein